MPLLKSALKHIIGQVAIIFVIVCLIVLIILLVFTL